MMELLPQLCALALVFVLLWCAIFWLKHRGYVTITDRLRRSEHSRELAVLDRIVLGPQHSLHLVRVNQRVILVGTHPSGLTLLAENLTTVEAVTAARESLVK